MSYITNRTKGSVGHDSETEWNEETNKISDETEPNIVTDGQPLQEAGIGED